METKVSNKKRFYKPWHFFTIAKKRPLRGLWEVFQNYHLDDLKQELQFWMELALCNDNCAYYEGAVREDLIDFINQLERLLEAFHILNEIKNRHRKSKKIKSLSKPALKMIAQMNNPVLLKDNEMKHPNLVITEFCETFRQSYAQMELLDLLEAVITYEGHKQVYNGQLVLFYEHLYYLTKLAYRIYKRKKYLYNGA